MVAPCYYLACRIFEDAGFGGRLRAVPESPDGIDVDFLERELMRGGKDNFDSTREPVSSFFSFWFQKFLGNHRLVEVATTIPTSIGILRVESLGGIWVNLVHSSLGNMIASHPYESPSCGCWQAILKLLLDSMVIPQQEASFGSLNHYFHET